MTPKSKKITMEATSVLLGAGLMLGVNSRPVKATSSREDEISEVESVNVLSTEKAKVKIGVKQIADTASTENSTETGSQETVLKTDNTSNNIEGQVADSETKTPTYSDSVAEVDEINQENDQKLQDAINDAADKGLNVEISDKKEEIPTTVGGIKENKDKLDQYTDEQIKIIQNYLSEHQQELEKYKNDKDKYDEAINNYINELINRGLLKEEDREEAKKGELGQQLVLGREDDAQVEVEVLKDKFINLEYDSHYIKEYDIYGTIEGAFLKVTYTNLSQSTYKGEKIGKIEFIYFDLISDRSSHFMVYTSYYPGEFHTHAKSITVTMKLYDSTGEKPIILDENTAFIKSYGYNDSAETIKGENNNGTVGTDNIFNVSGDSIKIKLNSNNGDFIDSWFSTSYLPKELNFNVEKPKQPSITVTPGQLVLNKNSAVHIHYVDVNEIAGSKFKPEQGIELDEHKQSITHLAAGDKYENTLWDWTQDGYILATDSIDLSAKAGEVGDTDTDYYIYLKHGQSEKVVEEKNVTRVIHYVYDENSGGGEASTDVTETIRFQHKVLVDNVSQGIVVDQGWVAQDSLGEFASVKSPVIKGYHADKTTVGSHKVEANDLKSEKAIEETVTYSEVAEFHVHYINVQDAYKSGQYNFSPEDGTEWKEHEAVFTDLIVGQKYPSSVIRAAYGLEWDWRDEGYTLIGSANVDWMIKLRDEVVPSGTEHIYVYLVHATRPKVVEESDVTRVIHYVYDEENGGGKAAEDHVETIRFYHEIFVDEVTGEFVFDGGWVAYGLPWKFESVTSPTIKGFNPDKKVVGEYVVSHNPYKFIKGQVIEETVIYSCPTRSHEVTQVIHYVDVNGNKIADDQTVTLKFIQNGRLDETNPDVINWTDDWKPVTTATFAAIDAKDVVIDWYHANNGIKEITVNVTNDDFNTWNGKQLIESKIVCSRNETNNINHEQKVDLIVNFEKENGDKVADSQNVTLVFKQSGFQDSVNPDLIDWSGDWILINPEIWDTVENPKISWFHTDNMVNKNTVTMTDADFKQYGESRVVNVTVRYLPNETEETSRDKIVTQTIHYKYEDGIIAHPDHVVKLVFTQDGIKDTVSGEIKWNSDWRLTKVFEVVASPNIDGYTADKKEIEAFSITLDDKNFNSEHDQEETVIYKANFVTPSHDVSDLILISKPTTIPEPEEEATPPLPEEKLSEYPGQFEKESEETEISRAITKTTKSKKIRSGAQETSISNNGQNKETVLENVSIKRTDETEEKQSNLNQVSRNEKILPETGNKKSEVAGVLGALAAALGITGLADAEKRSKKKDK